MDTATIDHVLTWVEQNVGEQVTRADLVRRAEESSLPDEGKQAIRALPEGYFTKSDVVARVRDNLFDLVVPGMP